MLPFVFVFNPQLLFIGVHSWWEVALVAVTATVAALLFAAATMAWFRTRCNALEIALLLVATFLFFRPDWVIDRFQPEYVNAPAKDIYRVADTLAPDQLLVLGIKGETIEGEEVEKVVALPMGAGRDGRERIRNAGVTLVPQGEEIQIAAVKFGSLARKLGIDQGYTIARAQAAESGPTRRLLGLHPRRFGGALRLVVARRAPAPGPALRPHGAVGPRLSRPNRSAAGHVTGWARRRVTWRCRIFPEFAADGSRRSTLRSLASRHTVPMTCSAPDPEPSAPRNASATAGASRDPIPGWTRSRTTGSPAGDSSSTSW